MRKLFFTTIFFIAVFTLAAQTAGENSLNDDSPINFNLTLKSLFEKVAEGHTISPDKYIVISGTVSAREVLNPDKDNFSGILELSSGEWIATADISLYRCYVQLDGSEFAVMIPVRRSRKPNPAEISLNEKILVLGKYLGYSEDEKGNKYPVIQGIAVRKN